MRSCYEAVARQAGRSSESWRSPRVGREDGYTDNNPNSAVYFDRLPIGEVDDLLEREAVDFGANRLGSIPWQGERRTAVKLPYFPTAMEASPSPTAIAAVPSTMMESIQLA